MIRVQGLQVILLASEGSRCATRFSDFRSHGTCQISIVPDSPNVSDPGPRLWASRTGSGKHNQPPWKCSSIRLPCAVRCDKLAFTASSTHLPLDAPNIDLPPRFIASH